MEAVVTISLRELEGYKKDIENLKQEVNRYKLQKEFNIYIDCNIYKFGQDRQYKYRTSTYGNIKLLKQGNTFDEVKKVMNETFDTMINNSVELKFYRKFPKWIHKLFKCNK